MALGKLAEIATINRAAGGVSRFLYLHWDNRTHRIHIHTGTHCHPIDGL